MSNGHCGPACGYCGSCGGVFEEVLADAPDINSTHWIPSAEGWREMSADERLDYLTREGFHANSFRILAVTLYRALGGRSDRVLAMLEEADEHGLIRAIDDLTAQLTTQ